MNDIPSQIRRRRAAANRCPVMPDGRRDPIGGKRIPGVPVTVLNDNTTFIGEHPAAMRGIRAIGCRFQRARGGGWLIEGRATDDLCAWFDANDYRVDARL